MLEYVQHRSLRGIIRLPMIAVLNDYTDPLDAHGVSRQAETRVETEAKHCSDSWGAVRGGDKSGSTRNSFAVGNERRKGASLLRRVIYCHAGLNYFATRLTVLTDRIAVVVGYWNYLC